MSELVHPVFTGLTRPPMVWGVTLDYLSFISIVVLCVFILTNRWQALLIWLPLYITGVLVCWFDPNGFRVIACRLQCLPVRNKSYWRTQSYAAF